MAEINFFFLSETPLSSMAIQIISFLDHLTPKVSTIYFTTLGCILSFLVTAFIRRYLFMRQCDKIPGPPAEIPLFGSLSELFLKPEDTVPYFLKTYKKWSNHSSLMRIWIGPFPIFFIGTAEDAEVIFKKKKNIVKGSLYRFLQPWLGTGLLTSTGSKWEYRRKLLTPAFHFKNLRNYIDIFNQQSQILVNKLNEKIVKSGNELDVYPLIYLCTLDIICETVIGHHANAQNQIDSEYVKAVAKVANIIQKRQFRPWLHFDWLFNMSRTSLEQKRCLSILHGFTDRMIRERKVLHQLNKSKPTFREDDEDHYLIPKKSRKAFLDLLIEASHDGQVLSDLDIREEVDVFTFGGHDTIGALISFSLFFISSHLKVQEQINEELTNVFSGSNRPITMADLSELKYLECCIKEALRLCSSIPAFSRQLSEDETIGGYKIPSGATVVISCGLIHRDPKYFPDPESFKPERFFESNTHNRHPYAYIPFSAGPRNCIGQRFALLEGKVILASILRKFHVKSSKKLEDIGLLAELTLKPRNGIRILMTPKHLP